MPGCDRINFRLSDKSKIFDHPVVSFHSNSCMLFVVCVQAHKMALATGQLYLIILFVNYKIAVKLAITANNPVCPNDSLVKGMIS